MSDDQRISRSQGEKLAALVHELRPDWGVQGIFSQLGEAVAGGYGDPFELSLSAIRAAQDPSNKKPGMIRMPGKHRTVEADLEQALADLKAAQDKLAGKYAAPATNDPRCDEHPGEHFSNCRECAKSKTPMPSNFRELAGIVPKQRTQRPRKRWVGREPMEGADRPGESHTDPKEGTAA